MKRLFTSAVIIAFFSLSALAETSPFEKFAGNYQSSDCKCVGTGLDSYSHDPCSLETVTIRTYQYLPTQKAWILEEIFTANYVVRPLDEFSLSPYLRTEAPVTLSTRGDETKASALLTEDSGITNYEIRKLSEKEYQYVSGFKGVSSKGEKINLQCSANLIKSYSFSEDMAL